MHIWPLKLVNELRSIWSSQNHGIKWNFNRWICINRIRVMFIDPCKMLLFEIISTLVKYLMCMKLNELNWPGQKFMEWINSSEILGKWKLSSRSCFFSSFLFWQKKSVANFLAVWLFIFFWIQRKRTDFSSQCIYLLTRWVFIKLKSGYVLLLLYHSFDLKPELHRYKQYKRYSRHQYAMQTFWISGARDECEKRKTFCSSRFL